MKFKIIFMLFLVLGITSVYFSYIHLPPRKHTRIKNDIRINRSNKSIIEKYRHESAEKWIVVTTISNPTPDIRFLAQIPGWKMVVVGDTKTPSDWRLSNCIYLSLDDQGGLGFETVSLLPVRSYARKTAGYLFAIAHGAKVIYETDDDNRPIDLLNGFVLNTTMWGLSYSGRGFFNPYRHFGQPTLWPRGYPLSAVGEHFTTNYQLGPYKTPSIQQGLVNGDPDMDAMFRLTRKQTLAVLNITFDGRAPPAIVPAGVFAPFNSQNTLFLYDALWALLIPTTTTFRVCDIWRGYWSQRLLWEIGGYLAFFPPNAFQKRNSHSYILDAVDEKDLYFQTEGLLTFLKSWHCKPENSFFACIIQLSSDMAKANFWKKEDKILTINWISDLKACGYKEPIRIPFASMELGPTIGKRNILLKQTPAQSRVSNLTFWAAEQRPPLIYPQDKSTPVMSHVEAISAYCNSSSVFPSSGSTRTFPHILLIVVFNSPFYKNIPILEMMYKLHFPHIVYCGAKKTEYDKQAEHMKPVTFLEVDVGFGWFAQNCLTQAMKMNYNVEGYLYIGDDVLLNVWNLHSLPWGNLWFVGVPSRRFSGDTKGKAWYRRPYIVKGYQEVMKSANSSDRFRKLSDMLLRNTGYKDGFYKSASDIVYIPKRYEVDVGYFLERFSRNELPVEITIPTVIYGVEMYGKVFKLSGGYLWTRAQRDQYEKYFNKNAIFLHPVKLSKELKTEKGRNFFCKTFLPLTLQDVRFFNFWS